jgi:hypothetical protein
MKTGNSWALVGSKSIGELGVLSMGVLNSDSVGLVNSTGGKKSEKGFWK